MRENIYKVLQKIYGITMMIAFFGGIVPLIPYIIAVIIGGPAAEKLMLFFSTKYYPWIIALASISVIIGLIAMYVGKQQALSKKSFTQKNNNEDSDK